MEAELDVSLLEVLVCFVYLHASEWLLAVLVTTSGWHLVPGNQATGKLGGTAANGLLEIIPKLSMNYPRELHNSSQALSIDGTGKRRVLDQVCVCVCILLGGPLDGAMLVSILRIAALCVCVCLMILAVLVHWGNGACKSTSNGYYRQILLIKIAMFSKRGDKFKYFEQTCVIHACFVFQHVSIKNSVK